MATITHEPEKKYPWVAHCACGNYVASFLAKEDAKKIAKCRCPECAIESGNVPAGQDDPLAAVQCEHCGAWGLRSDYWRVNDVLYCQKCSPMHARGSK